MERELLLMLNLTDLIRDGQLFHKEYSTRNEYFTDMSNYLFDLGIVTEDFQEALETRELSYPTGLITKTRIVSLPHVESKYIKKNALFITCFETPIPFHRMDDVATTVPVTISFMLLIKDVDLHIKAIQQIISLFQDDVLDKIYNAKDKSEVITMIGEKFNESAE
ncbi:MAG: PTS system galactitol-specific IIA component [Erysipelotrichaceae bacterium]|nr:MAG: PTS system galactitol-specific IIA component [Erysipelotrichaceae bacterium]